MKSRTFLCLITGCSLVFFLLGNTLLPVTDPVESNYALTAKEMVLSGNWISPQIFGTYWYDKPIFIYWMLSLSYSLLGVTDFAARLPAAVFGAASAALFVWYLLHRGMGRIFAVLGALVMTTSLECWIVSHSIITDQMLFFFDGAALLFAYAGLTEERPRLLTAAYAMAAMAVLAKGPVGLILPGTFLLLFAAVRRNSQYARRIFQPAGILVFCLLCLPWYVTMYYLHGQAFLDGFLGLHNIARATTSEHPEVNVWYYYLALVPVSLMPWTGAAFYGWWKKRQHSDEYAFMSIWIIGTIVFYTLAATKYPTYVYIANLPLLLFAVIGIRLLYLKNSRRLWLIVAIPAAAWWLLFALAALASGRTGITTGSWLSLYIVISSSLLLLAAAWYFRALPALPVVTAIGTAAVYLLVLWQGLAPFYQYRSAAAFLAHEETLQGRLYFFEEYRTSLVYYTGRTAICTQPAGYDENARLNRSAVWAGKHPFPAEDSQSVLQRLRRGEAVTLLVPRGRYDDYTHSEFYPLTRAAGKIGACYLFRNQ